MDMWPYWMFEENIKLVNEIIEEENKEHEKQQEKTDKQKELDTKIKIV